LLTGGVVNTTTHTHTVSMSVNKKRINALKWMNSTQSHSLKTKTMKILYKELPPKYKSEAISISAGVLKKSVLMHNWFHPRTFLIGINISAGVEVYLGFWYINIYW